MPRRFSIEEKLAIVAETEASPVSRVARKHGVSSGLVFRWRKTLGHRARAAAEKDCREELHPDRAARAGGAAGQLRTRWCNRDRACGQSADHLWTGF
jgi:transposase-like protein